MDKYLDVIKTVPLFREIEENDILSLLKCLGAKKVEYESNTTIFHEGDETSLVGIVLSGEVKIVKDDFYGNRNIVASVSKGHLFGEAFTCADVSTLPVSVLTTCQSVVMLINYKKIITTCSNCCDFHNKLIYNMLKVVANKNVLLNQKLEFISKRTTKEKLLSYLSSEAKKSGSSSFTISFNRQELADFLFVDRSAMSNELCKLRDEGIIEFNKNKFKLL